MKLIETEEKKISGLSIRTTNANEMSPDTAKIGALHQRFDEVVSVDYQNGSRVYGVYFDYESDASGEFSVLAGTDKVASSKQELEEIVLSAGKYLVFSGKGDMPQTVIDVWGEIWAYFSAEAEYERAYTYDYEFYKSQDEVDVYIAVK